MNRVTNKDTLLQGKVAAVLNERELAINIGTSKGVQVGMRFRVLAENPSEVVDPETAEILGYVDREKVRVQVVEVHERYAICRTYKTRTVKGSALADLFTTPAFTPSREVVETLKAADSAYLPPLPENESYVKKGDRVEQLEDEGDT